MKHKTFFLFIIPVCLIIITVIIVLSFSGMTKNNKIKIALILKTINPSNDFWQIVRAGAEIAAKEFNVDLEIKGAMFEKDISEQIEITEKIIEINPSVVILAALDIDALVPAADKIVENGIPLLTIDSGINSNSPISFIATDNIKGGEILGEIMEEYLYPGDSIIIISHLQGADTAIDRESGVKNIINASGKLNIYNTYFCDNQSDIAFRIVHDVLVSNEEIRGIIALNGISAIGAAQAMDNLGLKDSVFLVGFDNYFEELKFLELGVIKALIVQKPFNMGYIGVKTAVEIINNESVPSRIDTGLALITIDNMNSPENQKLLFPLPIIKESKE